MKILVIGDRIINQYYFCKTKGAQGPSLLLEVLKEQTSNMGASLLIDNLRSLLGASNVLGELGSVTSRSVYYSGGHKISEVDHGRKSLANPYAYLVSIQRASRLVDLVLVGDYGMGAMDGITEGDLLGLGVDKPLFVLTNQETEKYKGCFAIMIQKEAVASRADYQHFLFLHQSIIDGVLLPEPEEEIQDEDGVPEAFVAALIAKLIEFGGLTCSSRDLQDRLFLDSAIAAQKVKRVIGRHLGPRTLRREDLEK